MDYMKKKINRIAHIHVWDKKNKGDAAIVMAVRDELKKKFHGLKIEEFPMEVLRDGERKDLNIINNCDVVVIGGGGILYRYFLPYNIDFIKQIQPDIYFFSVGYIREVGSRQLSPKEKKSVKFIANKAKALGIRDYYTKKFLIGLGVDSKKISLIGDSAILLNEKPSHKISLDKKVNIGLNLNYSGWLGFGHYEKEIINSYREVALYFQKEYKAGIFYLKHHPGEDKIYPKLGIKNMKLVDLGQYEQKWFYGRLDLVIGMMLHSCVMTFGAGTPEINVAYDIRNKNFAKFIGCPELAFNLEDLKPGALLKRAKIVYENQEMYREKFKKRIKLVRQRHDEYLDLIV